MVRILFNQSKKYNKLHSLDEHNVEFLSLLLLESTYDKDYKAMMKLIDLINKELDDSYIADFVYRDTVFDVTMQVKNANAL